MAARLAPALRRWLVAAACGVVLWVFALCVIAYLVTGNPPFLAFTGITRVALAGHALFSLAAAPVVVCHERG